MAPLRKPIVWITGASSGIGRAVALRMACDGWQVLASARRLELLQSLAAEPGIPAGAIVPVVVDVTDRSNVAAAIATIEAAHGPVNTAVLSAGTFKPMRAASFSAAVVRELLELNTLGTANCLEVLLPRMLERRSGRIVAVASMAGYRGMPTSAAYGASKAAVMHMVEALIPELAGTGVILQVANPGFIRTPLTDRNDFPMPFLMEVADAAEALVHGMHTDRFEIAFPRSLMVVMKIARLLPARLYLRLMRRLVPGQGTSAGAEAQ